MALRIQEVKHLLNQFAHKLPFPAKAWSQKTLEQMRKQEQECDNQNPWTFERIASANMPGIRKVLNLYDLTQNVDPGASSTCLNVCNENVEKSVQ